MEICVIIFYEKHMENKARDLFMECVKKSFQEDDSKTQEKLGDLFLEYRNSHRAERSKKQIINELASSNETIISTMMSYKNSEEMLKAIEKNTKLLAIILL